MKNVLLTVSFLGLLLGCQSTPYSGAANNQLLETRWQLFKLNNKRVDNGKHPSQQAHIILHKKDSRVSGFGGCNYFFATYQSTQHRLNFSKMGVTMMACPEKNNNERDFLQALEKTNAYQISGKQLILKNDSTSLAVFTATQATK